MKNRRKLIIAAYRKFKRPFSLPRIPTLRDVGYDVEIEACGFVMGPSKMPKDVADKLAKAFEIAANDPEYKKSIIERFVTPFYLPPEKITPYLDKRRKETWDIMNKAGILKEK